ncbi:hypothetical protein AB0I81_60040 [Nonomuraea sp. NPDC050404]|uniref:hypothetical protein n=1 Tax=Nonomuraea sp. NPDC050404 TaxID=3155783 RepID=UPI0033F5D1F9
MIDYAEGLVHRQGNRKCGQRVAGSPYNSWSTKRYGRPTCTLLDFYKLLRQGRVAVRLVYDPNGPIAVKVTELRLP